MGFTAPSDTATNRLAAMALFTFGTGSTLTWTIKYERSSHSINKLIHTGGPTGPVSPASPFQPWNRQLLNETALLADSMYFQLTGGPIFPGPPFRQRNYKTLQTWTRRIRNTFCPFNPPGEPVGCRSLFNENKPIRKAAHDRKRKPTCCRYCWSGKHTVASLDVLMLQLPLPAAVQLHETTQFKMQLWSVFTPREPTRRWWAARPGAKHDEHKASALLSGGRVRVYEISSVTKPTRYHCIKSSGM